jgi:hypothetical protein
LPAHLFVPLKGAIMSSTVTGERLGRALALTTALVLVGFGAAAIIKGLDGRSTVRDSLAQEHVVGLPFMTPKGIAANARKAGLRNVTLPTCSVAGTPIEDGSSARCFSQYMRIDTLDVTGGKTYAQMRSFVAKDGKLTDDITQAKTFPSGAPVPNPARAVWVTQTALTTALNTSYMAEQISLFGIGVGAALLLVGLVLGGLAISGLRIGRGAKPQSAQRMSPA